MMKSSCNPWIKNAGIYACFTCFPSGSISYTLKLFFYFIVFLTNERAKPENIDKFPAYLSANSLHSFYKFENGESNTRHPISGFWSAYINAVTAPILLPQIPILLTVPKPLKYSNTHWTSSLSYHPNEMYYPSDIPHPAKSNDITVTS